MWSSTIETLNPYEATLEIIKAEQEEAEDSK